MAHKRNCKICGTEYEYCPKCDDNKPTFYINYCSENCRDIALITNKHAFKHLTDEEAINELFKCDLSKLESFNPKTKEYVKNILYSSKNKSVEEVPVVTSEPKEIEIESQEVKVEPQETENSAQIEAKSEIDNKVEKSPIRKPNRKKY